MEEQTPITFGIETAADIIDFRDPLEGKKEEPNKVEEEEPDGLITDLFMVCEFCGERKFVKVKKLDRYVCCNCHAVTFSDAEREENKEIMNDIWL